MAGSNSPDDPDAKPLARGNRHSPEKPGATKRPEKTAHTGRTGNTGNTGNTGQKASGHKKPGPGTSTNGRTTGRTAEETTGGTTDGSGGEGTGPEVARRFFELWSREWAKVLDDPDMARAWSNLAAGSQGAPSAPPGFGGAQGWATPPAGAPAHDAPFRAAPETGPGTGQEPLAPAAAAAFDRLSQRVLDLEARLAQCEARLAYLERKPN